MKRNRIAHIYIMMLTMLMFVPSVIAQNKKGASIKISHQSAEKRNQDLNTSLEITIGDDYILKSNDMIIMTPVLRSNSTLDSLVLDPMVVMGNRRSKMVRRSLKVNNPTTMPENVAFSIKRKNKKEQLIHYESNVPYEKWMRDAKIIITNKLSSCADCVSDAGIMSVTERALPSIEYMPLYRLTFITPEVEKVKARSDKHSATFNFAVNKTELLHDYQDNSIKLAEVDKIIKEVQGDDNLDITEFNIVGYASPEGGFAHNKTLSEKRAASFANYIVSKFSVKRNMFNVSSVGEDWEGLKKAVEASSISDKAEVLGVINNIMDPDARDAHIRKLSNGATYANLLNNFYPPLRRTDYTIAYVARAFDVEDAKLVIETNPKHLSLNEMFLVAKTYPVGSLEFKRVFEIALRMFPDSEVALANASAAAIEAGDNEGAIRMIESNKNKTKVLNNLAIAYARADKLEESKRIFEQAISLGEDTPKYNIGELEKYIIGLED